MVSWRLSSTQFRSTEGYEKASFCAIL